ncbi:hypothetical protein ACIQZG_23680 [Lysinibacillus sp. NPDC096418]|uniref:hypothetical protein n=1 Tax=Lysinibacillus sp. NPDC096418 TaxID=3364138 RepID=UPI0037F72267
MAKNVQQKKKYLVRYNIHSLYFDAIFVSGEIVLYNGRKCPPYFAELLDFLTEKNLLFDNLHYIACVVH